jgi:hypothetical protein
MFPGRLFNGENIGWGDFLTPLTLALSQPGEGIFGGMTS